MKPRRRISIVFSLLLLALPLAGQQHSANPADPANPHASPEVRALVKYLYSISRHYTLSGQHNYPNPRQLFDRMVVHNGLHNLIRVWTAAVPGFGPNGNGRLQDFFPGLLYVDALSVDQDNLNPRWRMDAALGALGVGKVIGVDLTRVPSPDVLLNQKWAWFLISPDDAGSPERSQSLQLLYKDPRVLERAESEAHASAK